MHNIKMIISDLDGTLTDGKFWYNHDMYKCRMYNTLDGKGFELFRNQNVKCGLITSDTGYDIDYRFNLDLGLNFCLMEVKNKYEEVLSIINGSGLFMENVAFVGDDINDITVLENVGFPFCPANALKCIKEIPNIHILEKKGGEGVIREMAEFILGF
jgi:YrbI family 3-deoxy-D-manno-octulosonate 8-phosphate phosphatase